jgi:hypothetical protein
MRLSIRDFAELLGVGVRTVTKWQARGDGVCLRPGMQSVLDTALERATDEVRARFELILAAEEPPAPGASSALAVPPSLLAEQWDHEQADGLAEFLADERELTTDRALLLSQEWRVVDPPQLVETRSGRRVGTRLAEVVIERADVLRRMDDFLGGGDMHDLVRRELLVTVGMVRGASYPEKIGRVLLSAVGELCQLAGWVASDAGLRSLAERYYLGGVSAAHAADDKPLAANLLSSLSYQVANIGDPRDAVLLASTAYHGAETSATATTRALLLERVAWANARFGDPQATVRTLDQVDEAFADSNPEDDPPWVYWLDRDEIDVMAGRCLTELRQPKKARRRCTTGTSRRRLRPRSRHCTCRRARAAPGVWIGSEWYGGRWSRTRGTQRWTNSRTRRPNCSIIEVSDPRPAVFWAPRAGRCRRPSAAGTLGVLRDRPERHDLPGGCRKRPMPRR